MTTMDEAHGRLTARLEDLQQGRARIPCRGPGSNAWISDKAADLADAARACRPCPAIDQCRAYALAHAETTGAWGGTTPAERTTLKRMMPRKAAA